MVWGIDIYFSFEETFMGNEKTKEEIPQALSSELDELLVDLDKARCSRTARHWLAGNKSGAYIFAKRQYTGTGKPEQNGYGPGQRRR